MRWPALVHLLVIASARASQSRGASRRKSPGRTLSTLVCSVWIEAAPRGSSRKRIDFWVFPTNGARMYEAGQGEGLWLTNDVRVRVTNAQVSTFAPPYRWSCCYQRYGGVDEEIPDKSVDTPASLVADTNDAGVRGSGSPTMRGCGKASDQRHAGAGAGGVFAEFLLKKRYFPAQTFPDIAFFVASGRGLLG